MKEDNTSVKLPDMITCPADDTISMLPVSGSLSRLFSKPHSLIYKLADQELFSVFVLFKI